MPSAAFSALGGRDPGGTRDHSAFGCAAAGMRRDPGRVQAPEILGCRAGSRSATLAQLLAFYSTACWIRSLGCSEKGFKFHFISGK